MTTTEILLLIATSIAVTATFSAVRLEARLREAERIIFDQRRQINTLARKYDDGEGW